MFRNGRRNASNSNEWKQWSVTTLTLKQSQSSWIRWVCESSPYVSKSNASCADPLLFLTGAWTSDASNATHDAFHDVRRGHFWGHRAKHRVWIIFLFWIIHCIIKHIVCLFFLFKATSCRKCPSFCSRHDRSNRSGSRATKSLRTTYRKWK